MQNFRTNLLNRGDFQPVTQPATRLFFIRPLEDRCVRIQVHVVGRRLCPSDRRLASQPDPG